MNNKKTILIIEDEQQIVEIYNNKFSELGVNIDIAQTGKEGLNLARKEPDLIILDIMLPGGLNGFDVLSTLKRDETLKKIPVLILTNLDDEQKLTALDLGAFDYLVKANTPIKEIVEKIRSILKI